MGNLSAKKKGITCRDGQKVLNNNAYYATNNGYYHLKSNPSDSLSWSKPQRFRDQPPYEASVPSSVSEVTALMGKTTTVVDLSDTSTLTVSSDEISSSPSSDTLHHTLQSSKTNLLSASENQFCRNRVSGGDAKSIATSDQTYLNAASIDTPVGCDRIQPHQMTNHLMDDKVRSKVPPKKPSTKNIKPQPKNTKTVSRQPIENFKNVRSLSRLSLTSRPRSRTKSDDKVVRLPEPRSQISRSSSHISLGQTPPTPKAIPKSQHTTPRNVKQLESHNSHRMHSSESDISFGTMPSGSSSSMSHDGGNFPSNGSHLKNSARCNSSVNLSLSSSNLRKPLCKSFKSSNSRSIHVSSKNSLQSHNKSWASNPKSSNFSSFRSPVTPPTPKIERTSKKMRTHGLRKISDSEYQRYNAIINDFRYQIKAQKSKWEPLAFDSRSPSIDSKVSSVDYPRSKAYDETDDEMYSFSVSTTHAKPVSSQLERERFKSSYGDAGKNSGSTWSSHHKSTASSPIRASRTSTKPIRKRQPAQSYIVEINGNFNHLRRRQPDPLAIFCYKFVVNDGMYMQKVLCDSKDRRIETICRQTSCRIHVKRRWSRDGSKPAFYEIIIFARDIRNIEKCCTLFNIMFPAFEADAGLGCVN